MTRTAGWVGGQQGNTSENHSFWQSGPQKHVCPYCGHGPWLQPPAPRIHPLLFFCEVAKPAVQHYSRTSYPKQRLHKLVGHIPSNSHPGKYRFVATYIYIYTFFLLLRNSLAAPQPAVTKVQSCWIAHHERRTSSIPNTWEGLHAYHKAKL